MKNNETKDEGKDTGRQAGGDTTLKAKARQMTGKYSWASLVWSRLMGLMVGLWLSLNVLSFKLV